MSISDRTDATREWQNLTNRLRRKLARDGQRLVVGRGSAAQAMIVDSRGFIVAGPVLANPPLIREWLEAA